MAKSAALLFLVCLLSGESFGYKTYYVEDECFSQKEVQKVVYNIPATGPNSVGEMKTNRFGTYSRSGRSCLIKLVPPKNYGVVITIKKVDFRNHNLCQDYIKVFTDNGSDGQKLCVYHQNETYGKTLYSEGTMRIFYHTEDGGFGFNDGFRLIFTVAERVDDNECTFDNQFKCTNLRCIWVGATCDGYDNCGDASDESTNGNSKCPTITPVTIAVVALAVTTFVVILISVCLCCCKVQRQSDTKDKFPTDFPSRPNGGYIPLPGVTYNTSDVPLGQYPALYHSAYAPPFRTSQPLQSPLDLPPPYRP